MAHCCRRRTRTPPDSSSHRRIVATTELSFTLTNTVPITGTIHTVCLNKYTSLSPAVALVSYYFLVLFLSLLIKLLFVRTGCFIISQYAAQFARIDEKHNCFGKIKTGTSPLFSSRGSNKTVKLCFIKSPLIEMNSCVNIQMYATTGCRFLKIVLHTRSLHFHRLPHSLS